MSRKHCLMKLCIDLATFVTYWTLWGHIWCHLEVQVHDTLFSLPLHSSPLPHIDHLCCWWKNLQACKWAIRKTRPVHLAQWHCAHRYFLCVSINMCKNVTFFQNPELFKHEFWLVFQNLIIITPLALHTMTWNFTKNKLIHLTTFLYNKQN